MSRRKRRPEPAAVEARPPRWLLFGAAGLVVLLVGPPVAAVASGDASPGMVVLASWPPVLLALIWRSRLHVDGDGVAFTFLSTRHVPWSDIDALVASSSAFGLRGPHLQVTNGRPVPLNPFWRADGKSVPEAIEPWARHRRVRIDGPIEKTSYRPKLMMIVVLIVIGALVGVVVGNLTAG